MMLKRKLTETVVHELADEIDAAGAKVTPDAIIALNNGFGSYSSAYTLHKTYAPVSIEVVRDVDDARRRGRRKMRDGNE